MLRLSIRMRFQAILLELPQEALTQNLTEIGLARDAISRILQNETFVTTVGQPNQLLPLLDLYEVVGSMIAKESALQTLIKLL
jgi:hypothetical protein